MKLRKVKPQQKMMKFNLMSRLFALFIILPGIAFAQHHLATAKISVVKQNGVYAIEIPPALRSFSKQDLGNFRIYDAKGQEVPYFLKQNTIVNLTTTNKQLAINERINIKNISSAIVVENNTKSSISRLFLDIVNADVVKKYTVSGSNDKTKWYGLVDSTQLDDLVNDKGTQVEKEIRFPVNNYKFIKIEFNDSKTLPLNILTAYLKSNLTSQNDLIEVGDHHFKVMEFPREKVSRIYFKFKQDEVIDQIAFDIRKPSFYQRNATLFVNRTKREKRKVRNYHESIAQFQLSSSGKNIFPLQQIMEKDFFIEIENNDNPPLAISGVKFYQIPILAITNLEANELYTVKTGDQELLAPSYDFTHLQGDSMQVLSTASIYDIKSVGNAQAKIATTSIWQQAWVMWLGIFLGGLVIVYLSMKMLKDMSRQNNA